MPNLVLIPLNVLVFSLFLYSRSKSILFDEKYVIPRCGCKTQYYEATPWQTGVIGRSLRALRLYLSLLHYSIPPLWVRLRELLLFVDTRKGRRTFDYTNLIFVCYLNKTLERTFSIIFNTFIKKFYLDLI